MFPLKKLFFDFNRKNSNKNCDKSNSIKEEDLSMIVCGNENERNANITKYNMDNSLINSTNTDNIITSRKSQEKSINSGSEIVFENFSQNSGKFLLDSKGKIKL